MPQGTIAAPAAAAVHPRARPASAVHAADAQRPMKPAAPACGVASIPAQSPLAPRPPNMAQAPAEPSPASAAAAAAGPRIVAPAPLDMPQGMPAARVAALMVRLAPGATPYPRQALEVPARGQAYLLLNQLIKPKDRVRVWLAQVLEREDGGAAAAAASRPGSSCVWAAKVGGFVVVKESDARFIRQYGRLWGEDPIAEIGALAKVSSAPHPNVVPLLDCFEGVEGCKGMVYLVLPHVAGDELFYQVTEAPGRQGLGEEATRPLVRQVAAALLHLKRAHGLRHGDVSPENVMVGPDGQVTLIDLGMAEVLPEGAADTCVDFLFEPRPRRGKKQYMAPEVYDEVAYDPFAVDVWALGALLYVCWTGCTVYRSPFDAQFLALGLPGGLNRLLAERESRGATRVLSAEAKDLLTRMLAWDFRGRATLEEVMAHPWMQPEEEDEEEEELADAETLLLSASTSFSSLSLASGATMAGLASVGGLSEAGDDEVAHDGGRSREQEEDEEEESDNNQMLRGGGARKGRKNNNACDGPDHGDSDNSLSSLETLHHHNNCVGKVEGREELSSSSSSDEEDEETDGEADDEREEEERARAAIARPATPMRSVFA